jgi:hypothetical protein
MSPILGILSIRCTKKNGWNSHALWGVSWLTKIGSAITLTTKLEPITHSKVRSDAETFRGYLPQLSSGHALQADVRFWG